MTREEFIRRVAADADRTAQDALKPGRWQQVGADAAPQLVRDIGDALSRNPRLSRRTQAHRLETLLRGLALRGSRAYRVARAARGFPAHLRMAVATVVPASARLELYGSRRRSTAPRAEVTTDTPAPAVERDHEASASHETGQERLGHSAVLLLSHPDRQVANRRLLEDAELDPMVVETPSDLERVLATSTGVCGCAIDQSALTVLDTEAQVALFTTLAEYSSFIAIRVHEGAGLRVSPERVSQILKTARQLGTHVPHDVLWFRSDGTIQGTELSFYQNAAELLQAHESASFTLGELTPAEVQLLVAAARDRVRAGSLGPELDAEELTVRFLTGGRSEAKLATVVCGNTPTFVAKIAPKDRALDEMLRFRTFVQPLNDELSPDCHLHGETAVILFRLVRGDSDPSTPAESLEDRLHYVWNEQWLQSNPEEAEQDGVFLGMALMRVARTLAELNSNAPPSNWNRQSFVNPPATHLDALEREGFVWGLNDSAASARRAAAERVRRMENSAIVHGDLHLRNVLIRGESEVRLIDYEASGPGHPALDLVRFELALYLGPVRQFEDEASSVAFQRALSIDRAPLDVLRSSFRGFFQCHVNSACAAGMTAARDAAIEVLEKHGGDARDYLAMKFLVAWQNLALIGSQTGLARAVILATAEEIATW